MEFVSEARGIEVGGAVWTLLPDGVGGTRGMSSGGMVVPKVGLACDEGVAGEAESTGPGGAG